MSLEAVEAKFKNVKKNLSARVWFKKEGWQVSVHPFPRKNPSGVTFHVFKKNWFNEEAKGIHIESHLDLDSKKQKKTYVTLHFLHLETIPGTKIKRIELAKPLIDATYEVVAAWPGYKFRAGKYGQQPFTCTLDGSSAKFESDLEVEVVRLCKTYGSLIDKRLSVLLPKK